MRKVSVVIPLFNKKNYVLRAVSSVLSQSHLIMEIIVVDDGSTDGGGDVIKRNYGRGIRVVRQENQGVSVARNRGVQEARGDLVAFLDADDEWHPHFIETITGLVRKFPEAGAFATAYEFQEAGGRLKECHYSGIPQHRWEGILPNYFRSGSLGDPPVFTSAVCVPKKIFGTIGGFKVGARIGEDLDMWGRIALSYPIAFSTTIGAIYYCDTTNSAVRLALPDQKPPFVETAENLIAKSKLSKAVLPDLKIYLDRLRIDAANRNVINGFYSDAARLVGECSTSFRLKRRKVISIYIKFPIVYRIAQTLKKLPFLQ